MVKEKGRREKEEGKTGNETKGSKECGWMENEGKKEMQMKGGDGDKNLLLGLMLFTVGNSRYS